MSASIQHTARRTARIRTRANRPAPRTKVTDADGNTRTIREPYRRPSRGATVAAAIAESRLEGAWA
ncbi:hypothetical protein [Verrucosispora sp. TAA-831]|uniref:hypothetical protein n=1 Tax=Verrucosispora sp. TAA-831 TaxID=3422227 RepID=UPI003D6F044D